MSAPRAVLLDALGTLLALEPPAPALREELARRFGLQVEIADAERAIGAEIAFYRAHNLEGADAESLARLRARCTQVLQGELGPAARELAPAEVQEALLAALRFHPFPEVPGALAALRDAGVRLVVASNWDCSLHHVLADSGLAAHLDGAVTSAEAGAAKPAPALFVRALAMAGVAAADALHVGDSPREDVEGARAAGIRPVLLMRGVAPARETGVTTINSLDELTAGAA